MLLSHRISSRRFDISNLKPKNWSKRHSPESSSVIGILIIQLCLVWLFVSLLRSNWIRGMNCREASASNQLCACSEIFQNKWIGCINYVIQQRPYRWIFKWIWRTHMMTMMMIWSIIYSNFVSDHFTLVQSICFNYYMILSLNDANDDCLQSHFDQKNKNKIVSWKVHINRVYSILNWTNHCIVLCIFNGTIKTNFMSLI